MATTATDPVTRYNAIARAFHAVIAVLVVTNLALGLGHDALEDTPFGIPLHMSIGITVLVLSIGRLLWRFSWTTPPYIPPLTAFESVLSKTVHAIFYGLLIILPLTGWIMTSAGKRGIMWFGLPFPKLPVEKGSTLYEIGHEGHEILGFLMLGLVALHVAAALRHHFIVKNGLLRRMW